METVTASLNATDVLAVAVEIATSWGADGTPPMLQPYNTVLAPGVPWSLLLESRCTELGGWFWDSDYKPQPARLWPFR